MDLEKDERLLPKLKAYCRREDKVNYDKLWSLLNIDLDQKQKLQSENAASQIKNFLIPQLVSSTHDPSISDAQAAQNNRTAMDITKQPIKNQIVGFYSKMNLNRDKLLDYLLPQDNMLTADKLAQKVKQEIKDIDLKQLEAFLISAANEKNFVVRSRLRDILFDQMEKQVNLKTMQVEDQMNQIFTGSVNNSSNYMTMEQLKDSLRRLGLNKSPEEVNNLMKDFTNRESTTLSKEDFTRLIRHECSRDILKERLTEERLKPLISQADGFKVGTLEPYQIRFIFEQAKADLSQLELEDIIRYCDVDEKGNVFVPSFIRVVSKGPIKFNANQEFLSNGLFKLRTALQTNVMEQYKTFEYMPHNYMQSFSEEEYLNTPAHLPTSTIKPTLGDSKSYYNNLYPPLPGQEAYVYSRVDSYHLVPQISKAE